MKQVNILTCQVGKQWYGIPVNNIVEVLQMVALNELPSPSPDILGLLTLRNMVMPVIDLRKRFMTDSSLRLDTPIIAVRSKQQSLALVVDVVDDVIDTSTATWQEQDNDPYITHTVRLQGQLFLILNVDLFQTKPDLT